MASARNLVKYGAQGAGVGFSIGGPIGGAIGGVIGGIAGLFGGGDDEAERRKRFNTFLAQLAASRRNRSIEVARQTSGMIQQATAGAGRRARASGGDAEDAILGAQQNAARIGSSAMDEALRPYEEMKMNAQADFADRPIEPNALDYISEGAGAFAQVFQNDRYIKALEASGGGPKPAGTAIEGVPYEEVPGDDGAADPTGIKPPTGGGDSLASTMPHRAQDADFNYMNQNWLNKLYSRG